MGEEEVRVMEKEEERWNQKKQVLIEQVADKIMNGVDLQTKIQAARDIRRLVRNSSSVKARSQFAAAGVIQPLVFMLASLNFEAREASLLALLNLAARNEQHVCTCCDLLLVVGVIQHSLQLKKFQQSKLLPQELYASLLIVQCSEVHPISHVSELLQLLFNPSSLNT